MAYDSPLQDTSKISSNYPVVNNYAIWLREYKKKFFQLSCSTYGLALTILRRKKKIFQLFVFKVCEC